MRPLREGKQTKFQSTLRRTERLARPEVPRLRSSISIHAPTNGATSPTVNTNKFVYYFNPRSDERSDFTVIHIAPQPFNFNPRSDERSDSEHR